MAEIGNLSPSWRIVPTRPSTGSGQGDQAPRRKPDAEQQERERRRREQDADDGETHIDEYA